MHISLLLIVVGSFRLIVSVITTAEVYEKYKIFVLFMKTLMNKKPPPTKLSFVYLHFPAFSMLLSALTTNRTSIHFSRL